MPVQTTYPGVYIEELPSGVHTIVGVSTSVTAFVGAAAQGAANTPVRIFSVADFVRTFGQSIDQDHPLGYAVAHFFTNGGSEAVIVRVLGAGSAAGRGHAPERRVDAEERPRPHRLGRRRLGEQAGGQRPRRHRRPGRLRQPRRSLQRGAHELDDRPAHERVGRRRARGVPEPLDVARRTLATC